MADLTDSQFLSQDPEVLGLQRQRKLADLLTGQAFNAPQGQMISGYYVKPSALQQALPMINAAIGGMTNANLDTKQTELAAALRGKQQEVMKAWSQAKTPQEKFALGTSQYAPKELQAATYELLKPQKLAEGETLNQINMGSGKYEPLAQGNAKYHAPTSVDMGTLGTMLLYPDGKREMVKKGIQGPANEIKEDNNGNLIMINPRTGQSSPVLGPDGKPLNGVGKPLTADQGNATAFGMRMKESNQLLNNLEDKGVKNTGVIRSSVAGTLGMTPFVGEHLQQGAHAAMNVLPGALGGPSSEQQQVDAARRNFVTAVLRKESGAAISQSEFYNESQKYFPQPGDTQEVIAQKRHARETAIKAMEVQAGPGKRQIEQTNLPESNGNNGGWRIK